MAVYSWLPSKRIDPEKFEQLITPHQAGLYHAALLITLDPQAAEDAVQDGLIRAYLAYRRFRNENLSAWLYRIIINEAHRQARRSRRRPLPLEETNLPDLQVTPEENVLIDERNQQLWHSMCRLSHEHRTVLVLRYFMEMSEAQMAQVIGIPTGTVKSRLFHAKKQLEQWLPMDGNVKTKPSSEGRASHA